MKCAMCRGSFKPAQWSAVYCSSPCRQRAYRLRVKSEGIAIKVAGGHRRAPVESIRRQVNETLGRKRMGEVITAAQLPRRPRK